MAKRMLGYDIFSENSKYGQFIIQTNEVQLLLILLILQRVNLPDKKLSGFLEAGTLGNLINYFRVCARLNELPLIKSLELYNQSRNALAHKMYTKKRLTVKECELSIELGAEIITALSKFKK